MDPQITRNYNVKGEGNSRHHNGDVYNYINEAHYTSNFLKSARDIGIKQEDRIEREIIPWLSSLDHELDHAEVHKLAGLYDRHDESEDGEYSGKWLWESDFFQSWLSQDITRLWLSGMPGAGKTTLASIIIQRMLTIQSNSAMAPKLKKHVFEKVLGRQRKSMAISTHKRVVYHYFGRREDTDPKHSAVDEVLGSLIRQMIENEKILPKCLMDVYAKFEGKSDAEARARAFTELFRKLATDGGVYVILDAIDQAREDVAETLLNVFRPNKFEHGTISVLVTSRIWRDFEYLSRDFCREVIKANDRDLNLFIDYKIRTHASMKRLCEEFTELPGQLKRFISKKCKQLFLLAGLQLRSLDSIFKTRSLTLRDLMERISDLVSDTDVDHVYDKLSEQRSARQAENDPDAERSFRILAWVVLAQRSLSLPALNEAVRRDPVLQSLRDLSDRDTQNSVRDICDGLIEFSHNGVRLAHSTTVDYFHRHADRLFGSFHSQIAHTLSMYLIDLSMTEPSYAMYTKSGYVEELCSRHPLFPYALWYTGFHLQKQIDSDIALESKEAFISFLGDNTKKLLLYRWLRMMGAYGPQDRNRRYRSQYFQWSRANSNIIISGDRRFESWPSVNREPLCTSKEARPSHTSSGGTMDALLGHQGSDRAKDHVKKLDEFLNEILDKLKAQVPEESRLEIANSNFGQDCKRHEAQKRQQPSKEIDKGFDNLTEFSDEVSPEQMDQINLGLVSRPITTTHLAAWYGYLPALEHFLEQDGDVNAVDEFGRTPIIIALQRGSMDAVEICVNHNAQIDLAMTEGQKIFLHISRQETPKESLIRTIIWQNQSRLHNPVQSQPGHKLKNTLIMMPILLGCYAFTSLKSFAPFRLMGPMQLRHTVRAMHYLNKPNNALKIFRHLKMDNILAAAWEGDLSAIRRNMVSGDQSQVRLGMVSVFMAVELGRGDTVVNLIDNGVDVNIQDFHGSTPLIRAAARRDAAIVRALLDRKADVKIENHKGQTAWSIRLKEDNLEVIKMLADHGGASPDAVDHSGLPMLYCVAAGGHINAVKFLLECGLNPSNRTIFGWAPLHWAAGNGYFECVAALLEGGAEHSPLSDTAKTPLDMAERAGWARIVMLLKQSGAKRAEDIYASTGRLWSDDSIVWDTRQFMDFLRDGESTTEALSDSDESLCCSDQEDVDETRYDNRSRYHDAIFMRDCQDGFEAALLRSEELTTISNSAKKIIFEFFFRQFDSVIKDIDGFFGEAENSQVQLPEEVSRRWEMISDRLKQRQVIREILLGN